MTRNEHGHVNQLIQEVSTELGLPLEHVIQLETSVDDVTGETLGRVMETLMEQQLALDVNFIPITMKHSRPGTLIRVLVHPDSLKKVIQFLMNELGTLGIRMEPITRIVAFRDHVTETITVNGQEVSIRIKRSWNADGVLIHWKPEHKDVVKAAKSLNIPMKSILHSLQQAINPTTWQLEKKGNDP